ncbi:hypothetical protein G7A68_03060 [Shewanella baltica]|nr:hypothetical protein [Shewanella baltica]
MVVRIDVNDSTFKRLEKLVVGFDTPDAVINRLIDSYENKKTTKPVLSFYPEESDFLRLLVKNGIAEVTIHKENGSKEEVTWKANKLTFDSNLRGNIWSGFLRGWKERGIISAHFSISDSYDFSYSEADFKRDEILSRHCKLSLKEFISLNEEFELSKHIDPEGDLGGYRIRFFESCDSKVLEKIEKLNRKKEFVFHAFSDEWNILNQFI